ncbi:hypothetical protein [Pseudonocardia adelaidensis]|uniref:Uncharacterized protein n=1 Tax=Pseudonocardia adelaidensis TaxID=648754 RepID=A0ABP9NUK0_9PSEU
MSGEPKRVGVVDVVPNAVRVQIDDVPVLGRSSGRGWLYATRGLEAFDQQELVLVVRKLPGEVRPPDFPYTLFATIHREAVEGRTVEAGGLTKIDPPPHGPALGGFLYEAAPPIIRALATTVGRRPPLLVVPLLAGEIDVALQFGRSRVLTVLGHEAGCHPFPWWFDSTRRPLLDLAAQRAHSILGKSAIMHTPYLTLRLKGLRLTLSVDVESRRRMLRTLSTAPDIVALLPGVPFAEENIYLWRPGQNEPVVYTSRYVENSGPVLPGDMAIGLNFLMLGHWAGKGIGNQKEDGFMALLPEPVWREFLTNLDAGRSKVWWLVGDTPGPWELELRMRSGGDAEQR